MHTGLSQHQSPCCHGLTGLERQVLGLKQADLNDRSLNVDPHPTAAGTDAAELKHCLCIAEAAKAGAGGRSRARGARAGEGRTAGSRLSMMSCLLALPAPNLGMFARQTSSWPAVPAMPRWGPQAARHPMPMVGELSALPTQRQLPDVRKPEAAIASASTAGPAAHA
eukprot:CAMPEP_0170580000 /NCGR_PEP_ID=MMETSP0224-20130122/6280_1 /TAXON_ID=285029 /ORGANISM="Togula jolla, Strain CCCM 725" /LENGTH=166 /DNA_ID=CAMNT_0010903055 /DNA_START=280 /DNA_END=779 /DNA_ORIENTATION=+